MKNIKHRKFGVAILGLFILTAGTIFIFAHGRDGRRPGPGFGAGGFPPPFLVEKISKELGLSEDQLTQAKQILEETKKRVAPLSETMKENHQQAKELGTDGTFDEAKVNQLAHQQAETMKNLIIEKEKTKAQLFAILTPEQREKAKQMQEKFGEKMKGRFGKGFGGEGFNQE